MCLYIKNSSRIQYTQDELEKFVKTVTKSKKTVYKLFRIKKNRNTIELFSPFRNVEYFLGEKYTSELDLQSFRRGLGGFYASRVEKGIHAFSRKNGYLRNYNSLLDESHVLIPCIIPQGGKYVIGLNNEIVSNELILPNSFIYKGEEYNINY